MAQEETDAIDSTQTIVRSGKTRKKGKQVVQPVHAGKRGSRVYISCCERAIASDRPAVLSIIPFPRGPGFAEITKVAVARNVSNEGTAATDKKTFRTEL